MEDQKVLNLLRRLRHDFGNDLQVIKGYLDLGNPDLAKEYLTNCVQTMKEQRIIFNLANPAAALYLYEQMLLSYDLGVILKYDVIELDSYEMLMNKNEPLQSLHYVMENCDKVEKDEEMVVYLEIYETADGIDLIYSSENLNKGSIMIKVRSE
jgi:sensor histidine kinase regulating citrate/malate metabolism